MNDGSRCFGILPANVIGWADLYYYLGELEGVRKTGFMTDNITAVWMDFRYRRHNFSVNNPMGEYWFFVDDPGCPEDILIGIVKHCENL